MLAVVINVGKSESILIYGIMLLLLMMMMMMMMGQPIIAKPMICHFSMSDFKVKLSHTESHMLVEYK